MVRFPFFPPVTRAVCLFDILFVPHKISEEGLARRVPFPDAHPPTFLSKGKSSFFFARERRRTETADVRMRSFRTADVGVRRSDPETRLVVTAFVPVQKSSRKREQFSTDRKSLRLSSSIIFQRILKTHTTAWSNRCVLQEIL